MVLRQTPVRSPVDKTQRSHPVIGNATYMPTDLLDGMLRLSVTTSGDYDIVLAFEQTRACARMPPIRENPIMRRWSIGLFGSMCLLFFILLFYGNASAQPPSDYAATTEQSCSFGMDKGDPSHHCEVPFPKDCKVAHFPGSTKPWASISKAGKTFCRFDTKASDWKTKIMGSCSRCESIRCSAQFSVRFDCS